MSTPAPSVLEVNLAALALRSPGAAARVRAASAAPVEWFLTEEGSLGGRLYGRLLCSARRPRDEAATLCDSIDLTQAGGVAVLGLGAGHHVVELCRRLGQHGAVFVFEPDAELIRAVLEKVDLSPMLAAQNLVVLTDAEDQSSIASATRGVEGLLALGVKLLEHPPSRWRLGESGDRFGANLTSTIRALRTSVVTTLMNAKTTLRNELMNLDLYATAAGVGDLAGAARNVPAIVVSAGPSLRRNIDLLSQPGVRERFVIIAVQTVLKPLLSRGIRPHFVTALDYHSVSRRFYEGLSASDVEGVTLVVDPKANPAILEAWPGAIRCPGDGLLDSVLGPGLSTGPHLARGRGGASDTLRPGATVSHLAYYLARHMGCDPVVLVGQDLGFTDGQYYSAGAAIHAIWASELGPFRSLEAFEWERIARHRTHLHRVSDHLGRAMYTDEQMITYHVQFERDFAEATLAGLTTVDATEGGVLKRHTLAMPLAEALERFAGDRRAPELGTPLASAAARREMVRRVTARAQEVSRQVARVAGHCDTTAGLLRQMLEHHADQARVNALIARVHRIRDEVAREEPAFTLVQFLNQTGTLRRVRADRALALNPALSPLQRQRGQIERDIQNVTWLGDAARDLAGMLEHSIAAYQGGPRHTDETDAGPESILAEGQRAAARKRVAAMVAIDPAAGALGTPRDLGEPVLAGMGALELLLIRLARSRELDLVVLLAEDPALATRLAGRGSAALGPRMVVRSPAGNVLARREAVRAARAWSRACWRGGLANLTIYDEALDPGPMLAAAEALGVDAICPIGPDWCLLDPAQVDATISRHRASAAWEGAPRLTFAHAAPGMGVCVLERSLLAECATRADQAGLLATVGGVLGYVPIMPTADPIAKQNCHAPDPLVRDLAVRCVADSASQVAMLRRALAPLGDSIERASAEQIAELLWSHAAGTASDPGPSELVMELCTGRLSSGLRQRWSIAASRTITDGIERPPMPLRLAQSIIERLAAARPDAALTLAGVGDPLLHPDLPRMIQMARRAGLAGVHVRTDLLAPPEAIAAMLEAGPDVVSIDLMAETPETYRRVMGVDGFERALGQLRSMLAWRDARPRVGGLPTLMIVPRITRCDATYTEIEAFYDRWLLGAGAAAIDPLPPGAAGPEARIEPLPIPAAGARRLARERMFVLCDGRVPAGEHDTHGERALGDLGREELDEVYRRWCLRRREPAPQPEPKPARAPVGAP